jgi:hypothetical protein
VSIIAVIQIPKKRARNPLGVWQERKQVMRDRRNRRPKDARAKRRAYEQD